jgi:ATP-dependent protease HslVU (ClpYQ) peptidase subunit
MTCVVGLLSEGKVYMGCDTRSRTITSNSEVVNGFFEKIFQKNGFLFGICGNALYFNILKYRFNPPTRPTKVPELKYLKTLFVNKIQDCLKEAKYLEKDENVSILLGSDKLYCIDSIYNVVEIKDPYFSIGSGSDYALRALEATRQLDLTPKERIELALKEACKFDNACSPPFIIKELER